MDHYGVLGRRVSTGFGKCILALNLISSSCLCPVEWDDTNECGLVEKCFLINVLVADTVS